MSIMNIEELWSRLMMPPLNDNKSWVIGRKMVANIEPYWPEDDDVNPELRSEAIRFVDLAKDAGVVPPDTAYGTGPGWPMLEWFFIDGRGRAGGDIVSPGIIEFMFSDDSKATPQFYSVSF